MQFGTAVAPILPQALTEYVAHYHAERNHQGKDNVLLFPRDTQTRQGGPVQCRERLGGLLHYYHQEAAGGKVSDDPVAGGRLHLGSDHYAAGKRPGVTEHCLRGRPVKPRRTGQQSTRFNSFNQSPWINILTIRAFCERCRHLAPGTRRLDLVRCSPPNLLRPEPIDTLSAS
jgi:hypothetical protein